MAPTPTHITDTMLDYWREQNDNGEGYGIGDETDTPAEAAEAEGWTILVRGVEGMVLCQHGETLSLVCNANGPWVVDLMHDEE